MAKSENNEVMFGARGQVGNLVIFKKYYGRTIIAKVQTKQENPTYSADQQLAKERFKEGAYYAKSVLGNEALSSFYRPFEKGPVKIYNLALADYCKPPKVTAIGADRYFGNPDDELIIRAVDNFKVVSVMVTITKMDGELIESGPAQQSANGADWVYKATAAANLWEGIILKAQATDTPGNVSELTKTVS